MARFYQATVIVDILVVTQKMVLRVISVGGDSLRVVTAMGDRRSPPCLDLRRRKSNRGFGERLPTYVVYDGNSNFMINCKLSRMNFYDKIGREILECPAGRSVGPLAPP